MGNAGRPGAGGPDRPKQTFGLAGWHLDPCRWLLRSQRLVAIRAKCAYSCRRGSGRLHRRPIGPNADLHVQQFVLLCNRSTWKTKLPFKTNGTGKETFPVPQSCGRWVVSGWRLWGSSLLRLSNAWTSEGRGRTSVAAAHLPAPQGRACPKAGNSIGVVGPDGASVHLCQNMIWIFWAFDC